MKIGFFGTPEIAAYALEKLSSEHEILFAVTCLDKPQGRSQRVCASNVKECAESTGIPVLQPDDINSDDFCKKLKKYNAEIFVVVAFGYIIPRKIFSMPPLGTINLHPSLLPKYRGAAPMRWAIIHGEKETGVTVQMIEEKLDAGDIVLQEKFPLDENWNAEDLYDKVLPIGADLLLKAVKGLKDKSIKPVKQKHEQATFCGKISRQAAKINWDESCEQIHNLVRGLNPKPIAWTIFREKNLKIYETKLVKEDIPCELKPGEVKKYQKKRLLAGSSTGVLEIIKLQPENKKIMDALAFLNGSRLEEGECFK